MSIEERRSFMWHTPIPTLVRTIQKLMEDDRQSDMRTWRDAVSILLIRQT